MGSTSFFEMTNERSEEEVPWRDEVSLRRAMPPRLVWTAHPLEDGRVIIFQRSDFSPVSLHMQPNDSDSGYRERVYGPLTAGSSIGRVDAARQLVRPAIQAALRDGPPPTCSRRYGREP